MIRRSGELRNLLEGRFYTRLIGDWRKLAVNEDNRSAPGKSPKFGKSEKRGAIFMHENSYESIK